MRFAEEKHLLLGTIALLAPLPLPLNEPQPTGAIGWGYLMVYVLGIGIFLRRVRLGAHQPVGTLTLNLLGLAYIPFLLLDVTVFWSGSLVQPMMHLALFALAAKLYSLSRERDKWHAVLGLFFVFVTAMATSSSVGILVYLMVMLACWSVLLARFAQMHVASLLSEEQAESLLAAGASLHLRVVPGALAASLLIGAPLFFLLPRLNSPYVFGHGGPGGGMRFVTGFSDEVSLDVIGRVRTNEEVAMRLEFVRPPAEVRLRGAVYDTYRARRWERELAPPTRSRDTAHQVVRRLQPGRASNSVDVWLEPLDSRSLILPLGAVSVRFEDMAPTLRMDRGGGVRLQLPPRRTLRYQVGFNEALTSPSTEPVPDSAHEPSLDRAGITPEIEALAREVSGTGEVLDKARRIERHLSTQYRYTLDFLDREQSEDPISDFLFRYRSGHCEYFASAMVLMLRSIDIPARFVTGFLGAEPSALGYYIVRQSNAHAWVEAWVPGLGWQVFDPTPPAGRPVVRGRSLWRLVTQAYDFVVFRWDRYVISYGVGDQARLLRRMADRLRRWLTGLWPGASAADSEPSEQATVATVDGLESVEGPRLNARGALVVALLSAFLIVAWSIARWLARPDGPRAYVRLRRLLQRRGLPISTAVAPLELGERARRRFPEVAEPTARVIDLYLRSSFGEAELDAAEREELSRLLRETRRRLRKAS